MFKTVKENASAEIVEKKSKFIANVFYVETKEEAEDMIKSMNKKYHDARHNCYAYRIFTPEGIIEKSSDDGEPSGTAGAPILTILSKNKLANVLVIVTRYFGGILLGTGGLVKAYSKACSLGLEMAQMVTKEITKVYEIEISYADIDKFKYFAKNNQIIILNEVYLENVVLKIGLKEDGLLKDISEKEINLRKVEFITKMYVWKADIYGAFPIISKNFQKSIAL